MSTRSDGNLQSRPDRRCKPLTCQPLTLFPTPSISLSLSLRHGCVRSAPRRTFAKPPSHRLSTLSCRSLAAFHPPRAISSPFLPPASYNKPVSALRRPAPPWPWPHSSGRRNPDTVLWCSHYLSSDVTQSRMRRVITARSSLLRQSYPALDWQRQCTRQGGPLNAQGEHVLFAGAGPDHAVESARDDAIQHRVAQKHPRRCGTPDHQYPTAERVFPVQDRAGDTVPCDPHLPRSWDPTSREVPRQSREAATRHGTGAVREETASAGLDPPKFVP